MKYIVDCLRNSNFTLPTPFVWAVLVGHYGTHFIIVIVYLIDWIASGGQRTELLDLLKAM